MRLFKTTILAVALMYAGTAFAQVSIHPDGADVHAAKISQKQKVEARKNFKKNFPLLAKYKMRSGKQALITRAWRMPNFRTLKGLPTKAPATTTEMWANVTSSSNWKNNEAAGLYKTIPSADLTFTKIFENSDFQANGGAAYINGKYYAVKTSADYGGNLYATLYRFDVHSGALEETTDLNATNNLRLAAVCTAQAPDGSVYGQFFNSDYTAFEWGCADYTTQTRTTIAHCQHSYVALGITSDYTLYGVADDGNLYKIDTRTGKETVVGPTGVQVSDDNGASYIQCGAIDPSTNTFYWASVDASGAEVFYRIDLQTGAAIPVSSVTATMYGLLFPEADAPSGAPSLATNLKASFVGTSTVGEISFDAPSTTVDGNTLTGDLNYVLIDNGDTLETGVVAAGNHKNVEVAVDEGAHRFVITTANSVGSSDKAHINAWVGLDYPNPPSNVNAAVDGQKATITWTPPSKGANGGYLGNLTYNINRLPDSVTVATGITDTTYTDVVTNTNLLSYNYIVYAVNGDKVGLGAASNGAIIGSALTPPYECDFTSPTDFSLFTVVDANHDGATWKFDTDYQYCQSFYDWSNPNDDWLLTPPLHLTTERSYKVSFRIRNAGSWHNSCEILWGKGDDYTQYKVLHETYEPSESWTLLTYDIQPEEEGDYRIAWHDNTPTPNQYMLNLTTISVTPNPSNLAPAAPANMVVQPGDKGALTATISLNAPSTNILGNTIDGVSYIQLRRDGRLIHTFGQTNAGSKLSFTDRQVGSDGYHIYTATAYNDYSYGQTQSDTVYIGTDTPLPPENANILDQQSNVLVSWNAIADTGVNNGYVDPGAARVAIYELGDGNVIDSVATVSGSTLCPVAFNTDRGNPRLLQYALRAFSKVGVSGYTTTPPLVVGKPYTLPYKESFANEKLDKGFLWTEGNDEYHNFMMSSERTFDNDGGALECWSSDSGTIAHAGLGKVSLEGSSHPGLWFNYFTREGDKALIKIMATLPDGSTDTVKVIDITGQPMGWKTAYADLSVYLGQRYIVPKIGLYVTGSVDFFLDDLNIADLKENDLAIKMFKAPDQAIAGQPNDVKVTIQNMGYNVTAGYDVVLYRNSVGVDTVHVTKPLHALDMDTVSVVLCPLVTDSEEVVTARVLLNGDAVEANNLTNPVKVQIAVPNLPVVTNLTAQAEGNIATLNWSEPTEPSYERKVEDFESYNIWSTQFGDWTLYDGDKGLADGLLWNYDYSTEGKAFAFTIFNGENIRTGSTAANPYFAGHNGGQFAAAPSESDANGRGVDADNWLISPKLSGKAQTITLWVENGNLQSWNHNTESYDILTSTENTDTASFVKLGETHEVANSEWEQVSFNIPAGTIYFAIHHITKSSNRFIFGVDDVTYESGNKVNPGTVVAYNVYRDGKIIATVNAENPTYKDLVDIDGKHVYNVTVVYSTGYESALSNDADVVTDISSNISNITTVAGYGPYDVYTVGGQLVAKKTTSLNNLRHGVYIINGKKFVVDK